MMKISGLKTVPNLLAVSLSLVTLALSFGCDRDAAPAPATGADPSGVAAAPGVNHATTTRAEAASQEKAPPDPIRPPPPAAGALREAVERALAVDEALRAERGALLDRHVRDQGAFGRLLREAYTARGSSLLFSGSDAAAAQRKGLLTLLDALPDEAVPTKPYRLKRIHALLSDVARREEALRPFADCRGAGATQQGLCRAVTGARAVPTLAEAAERLRADGLEDVDPRLVPFVDEFVSRRATLRRELQGAQAELDVLLLRGFFQYAIDFRLVKRAHPDDVTAHPEEAPVEHRELLLAHLDKAGSDLAGHLRGVRPANPLYERTIEALRFYRAAAKSGGAAKLKRARVRPGQRGPGVREMKERLKLERYYNGPIDDKYDAVLEEAITVYQRLHLLKEDGKIGGQLYKSLDIPLDRRVRALELSLQRWRESAIPQGLKVYARVNIPQFEVEFWEDGSVTRKHKVIVGTNATDRNLAAGVEGRLNHTRLFQAELSTVVLNPTWTVPLRIKKYELDKELVENPTYYEDNNFEIIEMRNGEVFVRQGPGPNNALGRVKFLFPNEHSIYMHDTPKRHLFKRTYRAFSHGCIRTHRPIALAKWLLERQNGMTAERVDRLLASSKERAVELDTKIPIFIEYNTVTVDEEGRVAFWDDVYGYDRAYWAGELPFVRAHKIPDTRLAKLQQEEEAWRAELEAQLDDPAAAPDEATPTAPEGDGSRPPAPAPPGGDARPPKGGAEPANGGGAPASLGEALKTTDAPAAEPTRAKPARETP